MSSSARSSTSARTSRTSIRATSSSGEGHVVCGRCRHCLAGRCQPVRQHASDWASAGTARSPNTSALPDDERLAPLAGHRRGRRWRSSIRSGTRFTRRSPSRSSARTYSWSGAGPIGLMATAVVRHAGARYVVVSEPNAYRRELACTMGATLVIDPTTSHSPTSWPSSDMVEGFDVVARDVRQRRRAPQRHGEHGVRGLDGHPRDPDRGDPDRRQPIVFKS